MSGSASIDPFQHPALQTDPCSVRSDLFNLVVMVEIIGASLLDYCLMGAVFAR